MFRRILKLITLSFLLGGLVVTDMVWPVGEGMVVSAALVSSRSWKKSTPRRRRSRRASVRRRSRRRPTLQAGRQIPPERVLEIQRALIERGFLKTATGVYDAATVEAMKAFQAAENIAVSGYPTAHALHRLGLSLGPTTTTSREERPGEADKPQEANPETLKEGVKP